MSVALCAHPVLPCEDALSEQEGPGTGRWSTPITPNFGRSTSASNMKIIDALAERSKAVAQGAIPKGRGFEPHSCHCPALFDLRRQACPMLSKLGTQIRHFSPNFYPKFYSTIYIGCKKLSLSLSLSLSLAYIDTCGIRTHAGRPHRLSRPTL